MTQPSCANPLARRFGIGSAILALALLCSSCSVMKSRVGSAEELSGKAGVGQYFLPLPYVQIYAYQTRLGTVSNINYTVRSVAMPDTENPIQFVHNYSLMSDDRVHFTVSPEGLLERVAYRREPKYVDSAVVLAKAALSVAAPVPLPLKGDDGFSEFSKLVFKQTIALDDLFKANCPEPKACGCTYVLVHDHVLIIKAEPVLTNRTEQVLANKAVQVREDPNTLRDKAALPSRPPENENKPCVYYRPLVPIRITLDEDVPIKDKCGIVTGHIHNIQSEIIFCPDPRNYVRVKLPDLWVAPQSYEINFSGGTLYDVSVARASDFYAVAKAPLDIIGSVLSLPEGLFTVKVYHNGEETGGYGDKFKGSGGSKDPGRGSNPREKE